MEEFTKLQPSGNAADKFVLYNLSIFLTS